MSEQLVWLIISLLVTNVVGWHHQDAQVASPPTIEVEGGVLEGTHFGETQNEVAFLGVPYAAPPIGDLRWKPPQPVRPWIGGRKATEFGAACAQLPVSWLPYLPWNEDCLYLNVWSTRLSVEAKLPVILYLHGGSNSAGYSQMTPLGPALSRLGVVIVSANYRLGPFGFLAHPALTAESEHHSSGDYGLLDQLQSLRWIHNNVARFGGDPARVTVMGQSAGAVDICLLMSSPMAKGLFQRAILESGECQSTLNEDIRRPQRYNSIRGTGEGIGERFAGDLGVPDGPNQLEKLRSIPADEILKTWSQDRQLHFDAIVDGWIVPNQPAIIFAEGRQLHVPVLVGSNSDEATIFGHGGPKNLEDFRKYLLDETGKYADQEVQAYPASSDAQVPARYLQLKSDSFAYGAYSIARAMTRAGQKAFLYYFTYAETGKRAPLGAYHGEELSFLTGLFPNGWEHGGDDERLAQAMRLYWTQFAKTGDPDVPGNPQWPNFDLHRNQCFELGRKMGVRPISPQILLLEHLMDQILGEIQKESGTM
jgi:para-nitrobenzyl esterase